MSLHFRHKQKVSDMTDAAPHASVPIRAFALASASACFALGLITLYSSGVGLIDPKLHRAVGFALALLVGIVVSQKRRADAGKPLGALHLSFDILLLFAGLWSIWSFHFVQTELETALYDVTTRDAWPSLAGLIVFLELCRRLWGWGLFGVGAFGVLYLLFGKDLPGILSQWSSHNHVQRRSNQQTVQTLHAKQQSGRELALLHQDLFGDILQDGHD